MTFLKETEPIPTNISPETDVAPNEGISIERIKQQALLRRIRKARELAARMQIAPDGTRVFIRFSPVQRREHQIMLTTFIILAVTGLIQRFSQSTISLILISTLGGADTVRTIHHLTAIAFILVSVYHVWEILVLWVVKRERGSMWPRWQDAKDLFQMVKFNMGLASTRPEFDRFSVEEKLEYLALVWGTVLMIITGLIMWFPITATSILPGDAIPVSRALHGWEAILATLAILTWHMYHVVIKEKNRSIFTGIMTEQEMKHNHPLEYRRILAAHKFLQKIAAEQNNGDKSTPAAEDTYEMVQAIKKAG